MTYSEPKEGAMDHQLDPQFLRVADVATLLRATPRTVQLWAESGKVKAFKPGRGWRFRQEDVNAFPHVQQNADPE